MGEGSSTRHTQHAAQGRTRLKKSFVEKPDTVVKLPDGKTLTLRRSEKDVVPLFRKLDPKKYDLQSGKHKSRSRGAAKGGGGGGSMPSMVPFSKLVVTAFLLHQVYSFIKVRFFRRRRPASGVHGEDGQLVAWAEGDEQALEEDLDEEQRARLAAKRKAQAAMAQAMVRNALPKPQRTGLPQRMSQAHHSKPKQYGLTAKQRMTPQNKPKPMPKGLLQKVDDALRRAQLAELTARTLEKRQQQQQLAALPAAGPSSQQQQQQLPAPQQGPAAAAAKREAAAAASKRGAASPSLV
jgi:hypothetical protein